MTPAAEILLTCANRGIQLSPLGGHLTHCGQLDPELRRDLLEHRENVYLLLLANSAMTWPGGARLSVGTATLGWSLMARGFDVSQTCQTASGCLVATDA